MSAFSSSTTITARVFETLYEDDAMIHCSDKATRLKQFCAQTGIILDSRLAIVEHAPSDAVPASIIAVMNSSDEMITPESTLVYIPLDAVLSAKSCGLDEHLNLVPFGIYAQLGLALALYGQILKSELSKWSAYLASLPDGIIPLPVFWHLEQQDGTTALLWLRGTEPARLLHAQVGDADGKTKLDVIQSFYREVASPFLHGAAQADERGQGSSPSLSGFYRAYSLVSSRAFLVDAYHGLAMVPVADAFNHVLENHVHLESEFHVCPDCGSPTECEHDGEPRETDGHRQQAARPSSKRIFYEMVSNSVVPPQSEVFNTYGEHLTNAQLLDQYGFLLDINDNDRLSWSLGDLYGLFGVQDSGMQHCRLLRLLDTIPDGHPLFENSELIFWNEDDTDIFIIDSEGKISHQLWAALLVIRNPRPRLDMDLGEFLHRQQSLEDEATNPADAPCALDEILANVATAVIHLCDTRKENSGPDGLPHDDSSAIADLLDDVPEGHFRTRAAMCVLMGEWSVLDSCKAGWNQFLLNAIGSS